MNYFIEYFGIDGESVRDNIGNSKTSSDFRQIEKIQINSDDYTRKEGDPSLYAFDFTKDSDVVSFALNYYFLNSDYTGFIVKKEDESIVRDFTVNNKADFEKIKQLVAFSLEQSVTHNSFPSLFIDYKDIDDETIELGIKRLELFSEEMFYSVLFIHSLIVFHLYKNAFSLKEEEIKKLPITISSFFHNFAVFIEMRRPGGFNSPVPIYYDSFMGAYNQAKELYEDLPDEYFTSSPGAKINIYFQKYESRLRKKVEILSKFNIKSKKEIDNLYNRYVFVTRYRVALSYFCTKDVKSFDFMALFSKEEVKEIVKEKLNEFHYTLRQLVAQLAFNDGKF